MVDNLANGDITKYEQIYELSYIECLNTLNLRHYRDKYTEKMNRIAELKAQNSR